MWGAYLLLFVVFGVYLCWAGGYFLTSTTEGTCDYDDATYDMYEILCDDVSDRFCDVDTTLICDHIVDINEDVSTVMIDSVIIAVTQLLFVLFIVEMYYKCWTIMHDHMFSEDDDDIMTGIHHVPGATNVIEDEEEDEDEDEEEEPEEPEPPPPVEEPEEEEEEVDDKEEMDDEEEVM